MWFGWSVLATCFLLGCGPEFDFFVGPTPVTLEAGAEDQVPCDLVESLHAIQIYLAVNHGEVVSDRIMSVPLTLYPDYAIPRTAGHPYVNGLLQGRTVHVRILGPSMLSTALIHEYINHLACFIIHGDSNASHENPVCRELEVSVTDFVTAKVTPFWESGRCSDLDWR